MFALLVDNACICVRVYVIVVHQFLLVCYLFVTGKGRKLEERSPLDTTLRCSYLVVDYHGI